MTGGREVLHSRRYTLNVMRKALSLAFIFSLHAGMLWAQDLSTYEKILLPVAVRSSLAPLPGANGSLWQTVVSVTNRSDEHVEVWGGFFSCNILCPFAFWVAPGATAVPDYVGLPGPNPSVFLSVSPERADDIVVHLRVQDVSRQSETAGTNVPVIRAEDLFTDRIDLLDIPSSSNFRSMLRVYEFDGSTEPPAARVRIFSYGGRAALEDTLVLDEQLPFITGTDGNGRREAGFIQLTLPRFDSLPAATRLRIEVTPVGPGLRFWAFVSVTHNETQHLTVIAPAN